MTEVQAGKLPLGTIITLCFVSGVSSAVFNVAPLIVSAIIPGLGIDEAQAGVLLSAELMTSALVAMALSRFVGTLDMQRWALYAALLMVLVNATSAVISGYLSLLLVRLVAGACAGVMTSAVFYFVAHAPNPVRMFGILATAIVLSGAILLMIMPWISGQWGHSALYVGFTVLAMCSIPLLWRLRAPLSIAVTAGQNTRNWGRLMLFFGLAVVAIQATQGGYYAFTEQMGRSLSMKPAAIGAALSLSYLIALGGSTFVGVMGERFGIFIPLLIGMAGHVLGVFLVVYAPSEAAFVIGVQIQAFFYFVFYPYQLALAAIIDPSGRLSTFTIGLVGLGLGVGPMISGAMVMRWGYGSVAWSVGISAALGYLVLLYSARRMQAG